jgi:hypothetical protein
MAPAHRDAEVLVFPPDSDPFGPLLHAAATLAATGSRQAAADTAEAARIVKSLTSVPRMRFYRQSTPGAEASSEELFRHHVGISGNGILAIRAADLAALPFRPDLRRTVLPGPAPSDGQAWLVFWSDVGAAGTILGAVRTAHRGTGPGVRWLRDALAIADGALTPGPRDIEWG